MSEPIPSNDPHTLFLVLINNPKPLTPLLPPFKPSLSSLYPSQCLSTMVPNSLTSQPLTPYSLSCTNCCTSANTTLLLLTPPPPPPPYHHHISASGYTPEVCPAETSVPSVVSIGPYFTLQTPGHLGSTFFPLSSWGLSLAPCPRFFWGHCQHLHGGGLLRSKGSSRLSHYSELQGLPT